MARFPSLDRPLARHDLEVRELPDGCAILDLRTEAVHVFNPAAAYVLSLCDGSRSQDDIADALRDAVPTLSIAQARADVGDVLRALHDKQLLTT